jgi:acetyltransferase-like isoleucine patch superfamily enzyme
MRAFSRVRELPGQWLTALHQFRQGRYCRLGEDSRLLSSSRIRNYRGEPDCIQIANHCRIAGELLTFAHGGRIEIGSFTFVGEGSRLWSAAEIVVGDYVLISHGVNIHDTNAHSISALSRRRHTQMIFGPGHPCELADVKAFRVRIESDAWVGFNATILKGVTVGRGAIVAAASVVTEDVPEYSIVAGNPARVIGVAEQ